MQPSDYLDAARAALDLPSDYALQEPLKLSKQQLSRYRKNLDFFSDEVALRVAAVIKKHPGIVLLDMQRGRAKTPEARMQWEEIFAGFPAPSRQANPGFRGVPTRL